jgi:DNA/RNA-binding domain of Phe-tRNA-synthetase-like protein
MIHTIADPIREAAPGLTLRVLTASVTVIPSPPELRALISDRAEGVRRRTNPDTLAALPGVGDLRRLYRALGKDPSRYRGSAEALLRRLHQGKGLYQVNAVVDINNLVSIETGHAVGSYDIDRVAGPVIFRPGLPGESYRGIGKGEVNLEGLPVFADERSPFGSPTSDSERAMIRPETRRIAMVVITCSGPSGLDDALALASELLRSHASAEGVEAHFVT